MGLSFLIQEAQAQYWGPVIFIPNDTASLEPSFDSQITTDIMIQAAAMRRSSFFSLSSQLQQCRGIRVKVINSNLDQALSLMQRKMQSSGIERMIKQEQLTHVKNSEKRVLAKKNLERKIRAQDLARKLKTILVQKVR